MMRRCVRLFLLVISLFQTRIDTNAFGLGSAPASGAGDRALAIVNFRERELGKNAAARAPQPARACACAPRSCSRLVRRRTDSSCGELRRGVPYCVLGTATERRGLYLLFSL